MFTRIRVLLALSVTFIAFASIPVAAQSDVEAAHKEAVRRLYSDVINGGDLTALDELAADSFAYTNPAGTFDQAGYAALLGARAGALPDQMTSLELLIADGDLVVDRHVFQGTFTGDYPTPTGSMIPPNNMPVMVYGHTIYRFDSAGKIAEIHEFFDLVSFYTQLGILPMPEGMATMEASAGMMDVTEWEVMAMSDEFEQTARETFPTNIDRVMSGTDEAAFAEVFVPDFVRHRDPANPAVLATLDEFIAENAAFRAAMPDVVITADDLVVDGNYASFTLHFVGTFENELSFAGMSVPPNGNPIDTYVHIITRMSEQGQVVEQWESFDNLSFGTQFGLIPQ